MSAWFSQLLYGLCLLCSLTIGPALASDVNILAPHSSIQIPEFASEPNSTYEHILSFDARARFNPDGSMVMQEKIKLQALRQQIHRGIFRTLPLRWNRQDGKLFNVNYQIIQVLRNGFPEPYSLDRTNETLTIRMGSADRLLQPGVYNYEIQYQVSNHFSRFPDWDELYWNVTGNGWAYPIDSASFHLELPEARYYLDNKGRDSRLRTIDVYTGTKGEKQHNARILPDGSVVTSQPLAQGEGLTVAYTWPRAILATAPAPLAHSPLSRLLLPTLKTAVLWIPALLLLGYCLFWWRKNVFAPGLKMPVVVPLFELPATLSPGYLRYITKRAYDDIAFSSDLLNLVAKRGIALTQKGDQSAASEALKTSSNNEQWLSRLPEEGNKQLDNNDKLLLKMLFPGKRKNLNLSVAYQRPMQNARIWLKERSEKQKPQLFNLVGKSVRRAIYILLLNPVICGVFFDPGIAMKSTFSLLFLLLGLAVLSVALKMLFRLGTIISDPKGSIPVFILVLLFIICMIVGLSLTFTSGSAMLEMLSLSQFPAGYIGALLVSSILCVSFYWFIPRYSQKGLNDLAIAKGLKLYLCAAEKYRYQSLYPPDQLVSHFERLLPVALALDVGKTWANTFAQYLIATGAMSTLFDPTNLHSLHHFSQSCSSCSSPTPGTSNSSDSSGSNSSSSNYSGSGSSDGGSSGDGAGGG
ncbi:DUF2207 domain-containing protein, partial [Serratia sp. DD3]|uniref:DUF2207 domain-containing protein n=1 Tax=Serratia sp. DD3 TaxID=1410619 RepID=UPI00055EAE40